MQMGKAWRGIDVMGRHRGGASLASIDWPNWPTTTNPSLVPFRNGPKISRQGEGRTSFGWRNIRGMSVQLVSSWEKSVIIGDAFSSIEVFRPVHQSAMIGSVREIVKS